MCEVSEREDVACLGQEKLVWILLCRRKDKENKKEEVTQQLSRRNQKHNIKNEVKTFFSPQAIRVRSREWGDSGMQNLREAEEPGCVDVESHILREIAQRGNQGRSQHSQSEAPVHEKERADTFVEKGC